MRKETPWLKNAIDMKKAYEVYTIYEVFTVYSHDAHVHTRVLLDSYVCCLLPGRPLRGM